MDPSGFYNLKVLGRGGSDNTWHEAKYTMKAYYISTLVNIQRTFKARSLLPCFWVMEGNPDKDSKEIYDKIQDETCETPCTQ